MNKMNRGKTLGITKAPGPGKPPTTVSGSTISNQGKLYPVSIAQNSADTATHTSISLTKGKKS